MWSFSDMNFPHMVSSIVRHNFRASNGYAYYQDADYEDSELGTEGALDPVSQPKHFVTRYPFLSRVRCILKVIQFDSFQVLILTAITAVFVGLSAAIIGFCLLRSSSNMDNEQPLQEKLDLPTNILCSLANTLNMPTFEICNQAEWDYKNSGTDWPEVQCQTGSFQSPIDINPTQSRKLLSLLKNRLVFSPGYSTLQRGMVTNDGHTIKFTVDESNGAGISGGPLASSYTLAQFHFHWGSRRGQGSEHTINGRAYDAELHLVHYKSTYDSFAAAFDDGQPDSIAVLGIFLEEVEDVSDSESIKNLQEAALELARGANKKIKSEAEVYNWLMIQNPSVPHTASWVKSPDFPEYATSKYMESPPPSVDMDVRLDDFTSELGQVFKYTGLGSKTIPRLQEFIRQVQADVVSKVFVNFVPDLDCHLCLT